MKRAIAKIVRVPTYFSVEISFKMQVQEEKKLHMLPQKMPVQGTKKKTNTKTYFIIG